jgi:hypothetical protein
MSSVTSENQDLGEAPSSSEPHVRLWSGSM